MPLAADYPFLEIMWSMVVFFAWIIWIFLMVKIIIDIFRRHDANGLKKTLWIIFLIITPFVGVFIYLILNGQHMAKRDIDEAASRQAQFDDYVRQTAAASGAAGGATAEIERAKGLLDSGAITQQEYDAIKSKALAS